MSLGYAEKLSYKEDVGTVGMSELFDPPLLLQQRIEQLARMIQKSKHLVAFTGAGISTSCGIPDFRGPKGVWTCQREGKGVPEASLPFHRAMPSMTHMALVELEKAGILKFVISQNVDSLHLRSGIPREKLAELHGNSFRELCPSCGAEYVRDFEVETIGMKETSRRCSDAKCGAKLKDTVLDWEDALPLKEMNEAEKHCRMADIVLCLGTSLQITPACNLPLKCVRGGGKVVIVNLQQTPKDKKAGLVIHGLVDEVITGVMYFLKMWIPPYVRVDLFQIIFSQYRCISERRCARWSLRVTSVNGEKAPLPFVKSVKISFPERPELKMALLKQQPFLLKRETLKTNPLKIVLKLNFSDGCGCQFTRIEVPIDFQDIRFACHIHFTHRKRWLRCQKWWNWPKQGTIVEAHGTTFHNNTGFWQYQENLQTGHVHAAQVPTDNVNQDKNVVIKNLRDTAIQEKCCGQFSLVERKFISDPKKEIAVYAVATNIVMYNVFPENSDLLKPNLEGKRLRKEANLDSKGKLKCREDLKAKQVPLKKLKAY